MRVLRLGRDATAQEKNVFKVKNIFPMKFSILSTEMLFAMACILLIMAPVSFVSAAEERPAQGAKDEKKSSMVPSLLRNAFPSTTAKITVPFLGMLASAFIATILYLIMDHMEEIYRGSTERTRAELRIASGFFFFLPSVYFLSIGYKDLLHTNIRECTPKEVEEAKEVGAVAKSEIDSVVTGGEAEHAVEATVQKSAADKGCVLDPHELHMLIIARDVHYVFFGLLIFLLANSITLFVTGIMGLSDEGDEDNEDTSATSAATHLLSLTWAK